MSRSAGRGTRSAWAASSARLGLSQSSSSCSQYHRHPIVNLGDEGIGLGGQEGEDRVRFALGIMHHTPDPSKGKGFLSLQGNPVGHLALTRTFPLEAIR